MELAELDACERRFSRVLKDGSSARETRGGELLWRALLAGGADRQVVVRAAGADDDERSQPRERAGDRPRVPARSARLPLARSCWRATSPDGLAAIGAALPLHELRQPREPSLRQL